MRKFLFLAVLLACSLLGLGHWLKETANLHALFPLMVIFFFGQSVTIGWLIGKAQNDSSQSPIIILAIIGFRMITGLALLLVFYFFKVPDLIHLCIEFIALYLIYLLFELSVLLTNLRPNSRETKKP